jgi:SAM-dependent methyltransferase
MNEIIELADWWATPAGQHLLNWEQKHVAEQVANVFGFNALQLGVPALKALHANRMPNQWLALTHGSDDETNGLVPTDYHLVVDPAALPFADDVFDLIVLPHTLETSADPHAVLREVHRVLRPEGRVIVIGLNPLSLWAMRQRRARMVTWLGGAKLALARLYLPRSGEFIAPRRLQDWMQLLNLETSTCQFGIYQPAVGSAQWLARWTWLDDLMGRWLPMVGAVYMLTAVKRVKGVHLLGPAWKPYRGRQAANIALAGQRSTPSQPIHQMKKERTDTC